MCKVVVYTLVCGEDLLVKGAEEEYGEHPLPGRSQQ